MPRRFFATIALALIALAALTATARSAASGTAQPKFTARTLTTDRATGDTVASGLPRPQATLGIAHFTADEIRYNRTKGTLVARGHVEFTRGPRRLLADELAYNLADNTYTVTGPRLGEHPYFISGEKASGSPDTLTLTNATLTYEEPGPFVPTLRAGSLTYFQKPEQRIQTTDTRIGIGSLSLIKLPALSPSVRQPAVVTNATVRIGYRGNLGAFLDLGSRVPVGGGFLAGGDIGYYTERGLLVGPGADYDVSTPGGGRMTGSLTTGYIHDNGTLLTDILGNPVPKDRGFVTWRHDQRITPGLRLFAQANYWSDSEVMRDFRPGQFYPVQQPDNFIEADYARDNYIISLFARAQFNPYYSVQQRLPELRFDLLPTPIGVQGIVHKFQASAAALDDNSPVGDPTIDSRRLDAYYALERTIAYKDIATFTPVFGARATYYADATGGKSDYTRFLGEIGFDAAIRASGTFDYKNEKRGINGLRHLITPRLSYRYIPQADKGAAYIPPIDDDTFSTYLQPLGLGERRDIDSIQKTNTFRVGLDNTLQTRDKTYGSRDLVILNLAADYRIDDTAPGGEHNLSAIHAEFALMPADWLRVNLYQSFTPRDFTLQEINTGLAIHDGARWSAGISTHYLKDQINEYIGEGRYRLHEAYEAYVRLHYDARANRFNERSFGIIQKLGHNLWTIRYAVTLYEGHSRESNFGFSVDVRLASF